MAFSKSTHGAADDDVTDATETLMTTSIAGAKAADAVATDGVDDAAPVDADACSRIRTNTAPKRLQVRVLVHQCMLCVSVIFYIFASKLQLFIVVGKLYGVLFCV